jgi:hypothetical protein
VAAFLKELRQHAANLAAAARQDDAERPARWDARTAHEISVTRQAAFTGGSVSRGVVRSVDMELLRGRDNASTDGKVLCDLPLSADIFHHHQVPP